MTSAFGAVGHVLGGTIVSGRHDPPVDDDDRAHAIAGAVGSLPDGDVDADGLREACTRSLASFKVPRGFVRIDALPRNALGKVQKHLLPPWSGT